MPSTINGIIILVIALIPGVPGETWMSEITGLDWREDRLRRVIRIVVISVTGLISYVAMSDALLLIGVALPEPKYINPRHLTLGFSSSILSEMAYAYVGHLLLSTLIGGVAGLAWVRYGRIVESTPYPAAWDDLIRDLVPGRWVIVTLTNGDVYMGKIETADSGVAESDRDLILEEPLQYSEALVCEASQNQYLYLPSALIASVAVVYDEDKDGERFVPPGETFS